VSIKSTNSSLTRPQKYDWSSPLASNQGATVRRAWAWLSRTSEPPVSVGNECQLNLGTDSTAWCVMDLGPKSPTDPS
jgi:hypothetical protein